MAASAYFKNGSLIESFDPIVSSGGTTTLTNTSAAYQIITGTQAHIVKLPVGTTLIKNQKFEIINLSTGIVTVQDSTGAALGTLASTQSSVMRITDITTAAGVFDIATASAGSVVGGLSSAEAGEFGTLKAKGFTATSKILKANPDELGGDFWTAKASTPSAISDQAAFSLNGFLYYAGGWNSSAVNPAPNNRYDRDNNYWLARATTVAFYDATGLSTTAGYAIGGSNISDTSVATNRKYVDSTNTWSTLAVVPAVLGPNAGFKINGSMYVCGGSASNNYIYDETADAWYSRAPLINNHSTNAGFSLYDKGYLAGSNASVTATVDRYNNLTNSWLNVASLNTARRGSGGATAAGAGMVFGGLDASNTRLASMENYRDTANVWLSRASFSVARGNLSQTSNDINHDVVAAGGNTPTVLALVESYSAFTLFNLGTLATSTAIPTNALVSAYLSGPSPSVQVQIRTNGADWYTALSGASPLRFGETMTKKFVPSGLAYVAGNFNSVGNATYAYDDIASTWTQKSGVSSGTRGGGGAFAIDGYGYQVGGNGGSGNIATVDYFNETLNSWATRGPMTIGKGFSGASWNLNGFGYYSCGGDSSGNSSSTSQKYDPTANSWSVNTSANQNTFANGGNLLQGFGYVCGGATSSSNPVSNCQQFSDVTSTWASKTGNASGTYNHESIAISNRMYLIGGNYPGVISSSTYYDPGLNTWTSGPSITTGGETDRAGMFRVNGAAYVAGIGFTTTSNKLNPEASVFTSITGLPNASNFGMGSSFQPGFSRIYEVRVGLPTYFAGLGGGVWTSASNIGTNHNIGGEWALEGYGYVCNGFVGGGSQTAQVDRYNEASDSWMVGVPTPTSTYDSSNFVLEGRGHKTSGVGGGSTHEVFSPYTNAFISLAAGPAGGIDASQGSSMDGRGWFLAGSGSSVAQYYLNATNTWTSCTSPGAGLTTARVPMNGFIYACGADSPSTQNLKFNTAAGVWTTAGAMLFARRNHGCLYNGKILMAGSGTSYTTSAEQFNDAGNFWQIAPSLVTGVGYQMTYTLSNAYSSAGYNGGGILNNQRLTNTVKQAVASASITVS